MGDTLTVQIELPRDLLVALNLRAGEMTHRVKEWAVLEMFCENLISAGKAAEILRITKEQFIDLLDRRRIPYLDLDAGEVEQDVAAAVAAIRGESL